MLKLYGSDPLVGSLYPNNNNIIIKLCCSDPLVGSLYSITNKVSMKLCGSDPLVGSLYQIPMTKNEDLTVLSKIQISIEGAADETLIQINKVKHRFLNLSFSRRSFFFYLIL